MEMEINKRFQKFSWAALGYNLLVILWGAFVRASGSGAGCGAHWPLCNGEVIPQSPRLATTIEFIHRTTSGISVILILGLLVWAWLAYPKRHPVRTGAVLSMVFILTEALVGAGLVLFQWVGLNESIGRTVSIAIHLVNTFLLLASLALTAWWASGGKPIRLAGQGLFLAGLALALLGVLTLGVTGSINALGDTLFPATSLSSGFQQDFTPGANFLLRLRVLHPLLAAAVGLYTIILVTFLRFKRTEQAIKRLSLILGGIVLLQLTAGLLNLVLLAPVWMQLVHLLLADSLWITLVLLSATLMQIGSTESLALEEPVLAQGKPPKIFLQKL
jgi:heme A synthase